jgi:hypothetical protein
MTGKQTINFGQWRLRNVWSRYVGPSDRQILPTTVEVTETIRSGTMSTLVVDSRKWIVDLYSLQTRRRIRRREEIHKAIICECVVCATIANHRVSTTTAVINLPRVVRGRDGDH